MPENCEADLGLCPPDKEQNNLNICTRTWYQCCINGVHEIPATHHFTSHAKYCLYHPKSSLNSAKEHGHHDQELWINFPSSLSPIISHKFHPFPIRSLHYAWDPVRVSRWCDGNGQILMIGAPGVTGLTKPKPSRPPEEWGGFIREILSQEVLRL